MALGWPQDWGATKMGKSHIHPLLTALQYQATVSWLISCIMIEPDLEQGFEGREGSGLHRLVQGGHLMYK